MADDNRRFSTEQEKASFVASAAIALSLSEGRTSIEIELLALILSNVAYQLEVIAGTRLLNDGLNEFILP